MTTFAIEPKRITTPATLKSFNPATGEVVGEVPLAPPDQIPAMVARARAAQPAWNALGLARRVEMIRPLGKELVARSEELGRLLTDEMGKPLPEAIGEVKACGGGLDESLEEIAKALEPTVLEDAKVRSMIYRDPFGVCAAISPWNFPMMMPHEMVIPALVAGNTVVMKPSEETPLIAQAYFDILSKLLPKDVIQIVHGAEEQGKALVAADVNLISFTGSRAAGKHILAAAAGGLKRVILELGGKDPMIVLDDADVNKAAEFAARNCFRNAGQVCVSTERIYVHEKIAPRFEQALLEKTKAIKVGPGTAEGVNVGPMISRRQAQSVVEKVQGAVKQGAKVVVGGEPVSGKGNFVQPTILTNLRNDMDIMREETFGPVACIVPVKSDEEAIKLANDTPYGLGACVFGGDLDRAANVGRRLESGMIGINKGCGGASGAPWVGAKESGYGFQGGVDGHRQFTQPRVVSVGK